MLDFQAVKDKKITFDAMIAGLTKEDLFDLTNEMVDTMQGLIADAVDADVTFVPVDPNANDTFASNAEDVNIAWTLGHVIVHATASSEEAAFLAAEMARGVEFHGRSRYETPWEEVATIDFCRKRLEESRRMRLATLDVWPAEPHLDLLYQYAPDRPTYNAIGRFVLGLRHDFDHLGQLTEIMCQAVAARESVAA
jgi:hypothetical protein